MIVMSRPRWEIKRGELACKVRFEVDGSTTPQAKFYKAKKPDPTMTRTFVQMVANSNKADQNPKEAEQVIDARPEDR